MRQGGVSVLRSNPMCARVLNSEESEGLLLRREIFDSLRVRLEEVRDRLNILFSWVLPNVDVDILEVKGESLGAPVHYLLQV